ncbi:hypothetical protein B296_00048185 [Ensete ventricosum]|uniref:Uncharacterized protein n=1 Tax=Ensete ventricosum TaxID=4639 RepID=A0A426YPH3_ENSVE|nr:hypothetical protein B296_00048185 [Ensete ventricosum]
MPPRRAVRTSWPGGWWDPDDATSCHVDDCDQEKKKEAVGRGERSPEHVSTVRSTRSARPGLPSRFGDLGAPCQLGLGHRHPVRDVIRRAWFVVGWYGGPEGPIGLVRSLALHVGLEK